MTKHFNSAFRLSLDNRAGIQKYLLNLGFLSSDERLEKVEVAGAGNMNVILRTVTNRRSFILKQSLPWVRKFPDISAPLQRIEFENRFYNLVRGNQTLKRFTPEVYFFDNHNFILCLEDFGPSTDFTAIYQQGEVIPKQDMADIACVISELHFQFNTETGLERIENEALRRLNHEHIFELPLSLNNGFDLDSVLSGLQQATKKFRNNERLKRRAKELGQLYLQADGPRLLHGDYYPGSWLKTQNGFRIIDPEFCFTGLPEFELGVLIAHLKIAQQPDSRMKDMFVYYHFDNKFDGSLFSQFAGMEIIRRLIGLAQLPLELSLRERISLLDEAYELVVNG